MLGVKSEVMVKNRVQKGDGSKLERKEERLPAKQRTCASTCALDRLIMSNAGLKLMAMMFIDF